MGLGGPGEDPVAVDTEARAELIAQLKRAVVDFQTLIPSTNDLTRMHGWWVNRVILPNGFEMISGGRKASLGSLLEDLPASERVCYFRASGQYSSSVGDWEKTLAELQQRAQKLGVSISL
ncbi:hypothetical protein IPG41_04575 [Candidatus Peregrinibacteria bacterium]|nr:MAG: hypothetical protein IPG41_04575 [Candidatus Peregrinibacteria bacterium]